MSFYEEDQEGKKKTNGVVERELKCTSGTDITAPKFSFKNYVEFKYLFSVNERWGHIYSCI